MAKTLLVGILFLLMTVPALAAGYYGYCPGASTIPQQDWNAANPYIPGQTIVTYGWCAKQASVPQTWGAGKANIPSQTVVTYNTCSGVGYMPQSWGTGASSIPAQRSGKTDYGCCGY